MTDLHDMDWSKHLNGAEAEIILIFCESARDAEFFNRLLGWRLRRHIRFISGKPTEPTSGEATDTENDKASGWTKAVKILREERAKAVAEGRSPNRYFCLLDGEESVRWGSGFEIFDATDLFFTIDDPKCEGMIFLSCYEKENWFLQYANGVEDIRHTLEFSKELANGKIYDNDNAWLLMRRALILAAEKSAIKRAFRAKPEVAPHVGELNLLHNDLAGAVWDAIASCIPRYWNEYVKHQLRKDPWNSYKKRRIPKIRRTSRRESLMFLSYLPMYLDIYEDRFPRSLKSNPYFPDAVRLCDGKQLLAWARREGEDKWAKRYQGRLLEPKFGALFQSALIRVLTSEPRSSERTRTRRRPRPRRPVRFGLRGSIGPD